MLVAARGQVSLCILWPTPLSASHSSQSYAQCAKSSACVACAGTTTESVWLTVSNEAAFWTNPLQPARACLSFRATSVLLSSSLRFYRVFCLKNAHSMKLSLWSGDSDQRTQVFCNVAQKTRACAWEGHLELLARASLEWVCTTVIALEPLLPQSHPNLHQICRPLVFRAEMVGMSSLWSIMVSQAKRFRPTAHCFISLILGCKRYLWKTVCGLVSFLVSKCILLASSHRWTKLAYSPFI